MQRPNGAWCLPGGNADPEAGPEEPIVREVREETGLDVDPVELVDAYQLLPGTTNDPHGAIPTVYRCEPVGGDLELSREGRALEWHRVDAVTEWFSDHRRYALDATDTLD